MKLKEISLVGIAAALFAAPAFAHHSFAMFNADKKISLTGTVKEFQWTNPHSWIVLMVPNAAGKPEEWSFEMGSPGGLSKLGWSAKTLQPGDKITAMFHPLRDGTHGGQYMAVTLPDGKQLGSENSRFEDFGAGPGYSANRGGGE